MSVEQVPEEQIIEQVHPEQDLAAKDFGTPTDTIPASSEPSGEPSGEPSSRLALASGEPLMKPILIKLDPILLDFVEHERHVDACRDGRTKMLPRTTTIRGLLRESICARRASRGEEIPSVVVCDGGKAPMG